MTSADEDARRPLGVLDDAPCGFVSFSDTGTVQQTNATLREMLGYDAAGEIDGHDIGGILTAAARVFYQTHFFPLLRLQGRADEIYLSLRDSHGKPVPVLVNAVRHQRNGAAMNDCIVVRMKQRSHYEDALLAATRESERIAAELRESQHFLRRVAEVTPGIILVFDLRNWRSVFINHHVSTVLGYTPEALKAMGGDAVSALMHPDDLPRFAEHLNRVRRLDADDTADFDCRMRHQSGDWRWLHSRFAVFSRDDSGAREIISTSIDVTPRRAAEDALRASEHQFRVLTTAMPQLVWSCSSAGECTFQAPQWTTVTGQDVAESLGYGWAEMIHPDDRAATTIEWQQTVARGTRYRVEYRLRTRDGSYRWFLALAEALRDAGGGVLNWIGTSTDIDDAKRLEIKLRDSEERMRLATEATAVGIWEWNVLTGALHWDAQMFRIYGLEPTSDGILPYEDWSRAVLPEERPAQEAELQATVRRLGQGSRFFSIRRRDDGQTRNIESVETVRANAAGQAEWVIGTTLDVTDRVRMEAALREADRRKDEFIATLAHELRNPLGPISNGIELIKRAAGDAQVIERARAIMERQVTHIVRLVDDLLDVSRITHNKLQLRKENVDLAAIVQRAIEACRPDFERARQRLQTELPPAPVVVHADPVRLMQVFGNLLTNASKYTGLEGHVLLSAERQGHEAVVSVKDSGIGIPAEMLSKVFDLFAQIDAPRARVQAGLGIGLSLAKSLVEQHGGTLRAHSDGAGRGSQFVVRLPLAEDAAPAAMADTAPAGPIEAASRRVLIVDDNRDHADTLDDLLSAMGSRTLRAHDGLEAVAAAEAFRPDLVLLDIGLPGLSGYEACRRLRAQPWGKDIVIIAVSGWGQPEDRRQSTVVSHALSHFTAPFMSDSLTGDRLGVVRQ